MKRVSRPLSPGLALLLAANNPANRAKLAAAVAACAGVDLGEREQAVLAAAAAYLKAPFAESEATLVAALRQAVAGSMERTAGRWPSADQWWQI